MQWAFAFFLKLFYYKTLPKFYKYKSESYEKLFIHLIQSFNFKSLLKGMYDVITIRSCRLASVAVCISVCCRYNCRISPFPIHTDCVKKYLAVVCAGLSAVVTRRMQKTVTRYL